MDKETNLNKMMSVVEEQELRAQLWEAGAYLRTNGLTWGNAGNISARLDETRCVITASGTDLGDLGEADLVTCPLDGRSWEYPRKPSKELPMHRAIYAARPDVQAVLHAAPFYSTLVACTGIKLPADVFVENLYYLERVARVPYFHPGSQALAEAVGERAGQANLLLLENHGMLSFDTTIKEALMGLHTLEITCRMLLTARSAGIEFHNLPASTVHDFLENSGYRTRRRWPGDPQPEI